MNLHIINPATEDVLAELESAQIEDLQAAIARAKLAQKHWGRTSPGEKEAVLSRISRSITAHVEELARIESQNVGMPINDARSAVAQVADTFRYFAASVERLTGDSIPVAGGMDVTFHEPLGVVGLITPWNFPLSIASWKIAPALAGGNGVVLKPSELTPLSALRLADLALEAGLPDGLLSVVVGPGATIGRALVEHPDIAKIAFTGSTRVGRMIAAGAGERIKRVTLELGGKSPSIIFSDADLEAAAQGLVGGAFGNTGQDCCARSRVFVQNSAVADFLSVLRDVVADIRVGDPLSEETTMGPLISGPHRERVAAYVDAESIAFQGQAPTGPGYWFPATVLHPIDGDHRSAREEIFGPVVSILPFDNEEEVVDRANDTEYGLSGSIWTSDLGRAIRIARAVQSGTLAVNSYTSVRTTTPFGGFKQSGVGRELGPHAVETYTELKNVFFSDVSARRRSADPTRS